MKAVIITGGPGSGKSVIAVALLGELAKRGYPFSHATGGKSFTTTLRQVVGRRVPRVKEFFRYTSVFMDAERNGLDVLIVDDAHRIRLTSTNRFTRAEKRGGTRTQTSWCGRPVACQSVLVEVSDRTWSETSSIVAWAQVPRRVRASGNRYRLPPGWHTVGTKRLCSAIAELRRLADQTCVYLHG
jgi:Schlafen group 3, DNA/RNA helicase domain